MTNKLTVADIAAHFSFEVLTDVHHLARPITVADLNRPGIELAGYTNYYAENRVQILGKTEISFLQTLDHTVLVDRIAFLCKKTTPCLLITRQLDVPPIIYTLCEQRGVALLRTKLSTTNVSSRLTNYLENRLAPTTTVHGVLVDLYGVGVLITGTSGIGKSETALELIKRGHRLVADDAVEIRQTAENELHGNAPELIRHLLEIRGLGIINAMTLFGAGAVRNIKKISAVCHLEMWQQEKQYDRLGLDEETTRIIDTDLPLMTIPVRPGRNLAVIIEVAAMNFRLKRMGYHAAEQFSTRLTETLESTKHVILDRLQEDFDETDP